LLIEEACFHALRREHLSRQSIGDRAQATLWPRLHKEEGSSVNVPPAARRGKRWPAGGVIFVSLD